MGNGKKLGRLDRQVVFTLDFEDQLTICLLNLSFYTTTIVL